MRNNNGEKLVAEIKKGRADDDPAFVGFWLMSGCRFLNFFREAPTNPRRPVPERILAAALGNGVAGRLILPKELIEEMGFNLGNLLPARKTRAGISLKPL